MSFALMTMLALQAWAQDRQVTGKVTAGEDGSPLPGVNVAVKGTTRGTTTNAEGEYRLSAGTGSTLVFSAVGYRRQEVAVGSQSRVDLTLTAETSQLEEVVVTALGVQRQKETLGYGTTTVKASELTQARATNISSALSGKVAGLQINTASASVNPNTRIVLRGNRSLLGNNQALIVVDGTPVPQEVLNALNPNDIENVSVLKGANAAALYGSDASNGALVVTTKRGSAGAPQVTFSNTSYAESISFMPKFQNRFGGGTESFSRVYIPFENQSYGPEFTTTGTVLTQDPESPSGYSQEPATGVTVGRPLEDGSRFTLPYQGFESSKRDAFSTGRTFQNDLSLSAGDDRGAFRVSMQDVNTTGVVPKDKYRRTSFNLNADRQYGKFKGAFRANYTTAKSDRTTADFYFSVLNAAANVPIDTYKNWQPYLLADGKPNPANPNNYFNDYYDNPYFSLDNNRQNFRDNVLTGNIELSYNPIEWLGVTYRLGGTIRNRLSKSYTDKYTFTNFAKSHGKYNAKDIAGGVTDFSDANTRLNQDLYATVTRKFGTAFSLDAIVGTQIRENTRKIVQTQSSSLVIPGLFNVGNRTGEATVSQSDFTDRLIGIFGDVSLGYRDFLTLHVTGRNDYTSLLSKSNRSFFYPGADVAFVLTNAVPSLQNEILSFAKIRASATRVGNINVAPYQLQTVFTPGPAFPYGGQAGFTLSNQINSSDLKPEFTTSYEVGGEFGLLNNRISLDLAYYVQSTTNQTVPIDVSRATGFSRALINVGEVQNNGFEVELRTTPIRTSSGFRWDLNFNYSLVNNKVISLYEGLPEINLSSFYGLTGDASLGQIFAREGEQFPVLKVVGYARDPQGRVIVDGETGYPVKNPSLQIAGQVNPRDRIGLSTNLSYKGLTFSALAEYRGGNVIYHGLGASMWFTGVAATTANYGRERFIFPNSVIQTGTDTYTPNTSVAVEDGGLGTWDGNLRTFGENFVTSGAFWKLREVALTYSVPTAWLTRTRVIKGASIGLVGRNLLTLLPKQNIYTDPEFSNSVTNSVGLNDTGLTPPTRTYGFTASLSF